MATDKINLMNLSPEELKEFFESIGEKSFRAQQSCVGYTSLV